MLAVVSYFLYICSVLWESVPQHFFDNSTFELGKSGKCYSANTQLVLYQ